MTHHRSAIEQIVAQHCVGWDSPTPPRSGDAVTIRPRHVMSHDNTSAIIPKFHAIMGPDAPVHDPHQMVFVMDHDIQNHTPENLGKYAKISAFAHRMGIRYEPPGRGIAHQVMIEEGFVCPSSLIVGSDSHSNLYGALSSLGTPIVRTDAAAIWATGTTWWVIPPIVRVELHGCPSPGVTGKDIILSLCARFNQNQVLNAAIEFAGDGISHLSMDDRMTIANMSTEWGALAGWFPHDDVLDRYLIDLGIRDGFEPITPHPNARYARCLTIDIASVSPFVSGPNAPEIGTPVREIESQRIRVNKAYLMSCVNGRLRDFESAAEIFRDGRRVADGVEFYIAAASSTIERDAKLSGAWQTLIDAGAIPLPPGCGACIGLGAGTLGPGEVGISATNRNYQGRMGARDSSCYLASPSVVAYSASHGFIAGPSSDHTHPSSLIASECVPSNDHDPAPRPSMLDGFPQCIEGRSVVLTHGPINTDGIYGRDVTYQDGLSTKEMGSHAMHNYDPKFQQIARAGDILVAGHGFGIGSSREQAASALRYFGIRIIIAASASQTYLRNAYNNGLIVIECAPLAEFLIGNSVQSERTRVGPHLRVDFALGTITLDEATFEFTPPGRAMQELVIAGGLVELITRQGQGAIA